MSLLARRLRPSPFLRAAHHCLPRPAPASTSTATSTSAAPPAASVTADFVDALSKSLSSHMNTRAPPSGEIAAYIPQLAKADPESLGAAFCTVGGDLRSFGDDELPFSFQSCVKPFTYLAACEEHGLDAKGVKAALVARLAARQEERARKRARVEPAPDVAGVLSVRKAARLVACADVWSLILTLAF